MIATIFILKLIFHLSNDRFFRTCYWRKKTIGTLEIFCPTANQQNSKNLWNVRLTIVYIIHAHLRNHIHIQHTKHLEEISENFRNFFAELRLVHRGNYDYFWIWTVILLDSHTSALFISYWMQHVHFSFIWRQKSFFDNGIRHRDVLVTSRLWRLSIIQV